jgi:HEAT repeat protein
MQAIEALQEHGGPKSLPWIRQALRDEVPGVRFAAMLALGSMRDDVSEPNIRALLSSDLDSDRIAAIYALHALGDTRFTGDLAGYLLKSEDLATRRHAALVLGRMGEKGALPLLNLAMHDSDRGLRANVLEARTLLGDAEARNFLKTTSYGGVGEETAFSIVTLGQLRDQSYLNLFRDKLETALHLEVKLAAARALGWLGDDTGYEIAYRSLSFSTSKDEENEPSENRNLRVRQMAALAVGAIGKPEALPKLKRMMESAGDPRLQIAAAKAILDIVSTQKPRLPFGEKQN